MKMTKRPHRLKLAALTLLAAGASAAVPSVAGGLAHLPGGEKGMLRIDFELKGKELGKPIHRTVSMQIRMEADETTDTGPDDAAEEAGAARASATRAQADAERDRRLAATRARMAQIDQAGSLRACDKDPDGKECQAASAAMRSALMDANAAMGAPDLSVNKDRYQRWHAVQGQAGQGCGTIEAKVLDPGKPPQIARLPSTPAASGVETCLHFFVVDRKSGEANIFLSPFEIRQPDVKERGNYVIEESDIQAGAHGSKATLAHLKFAPNARQASGAASVQSERGVTTVRWTFARQ